MKEFPVRVENIPRGKSPQDILEFFDGPSIEDLTERDYLERGGTCAAILRFPNEDDAYDHISMSGLKMENNSLTISPEFFDEASISINSSWLRNMEKVCPNLRQEIGNMSSGFHVTCADINRGITLSGKSWRLEKVKESLEQKFVEIVKQRNSHRVPVHRLPLSNSDDGKQLQGEFATGEKPKRQRKLVAGVDTVAAAAAEDKEKASSSEGQERKQYDASGGMSHGDVPKTRHRALVRNHSGDSQTPPHPTNSSTTTPPSSTIQSLIVDADISCYIKENYKLLNFADCGVSVPFVSEHQTNWIFTGNKKEDLDKNIETLKQIISRIKKKTCKIPDKMDIDVFKSLVEKDNRNEDISLWFDHRQRTCTVVGIVTEELNSTYEWVTGLITSALEGNAKSNNYQTSSDHGSNFIGQKSSTDVRMKFVVHRPDKDKLTFTTPGGVQVKVYQGNMVIQPTEAIVNPANCFLGNAGGLSRIISFAGGPLIDSECQQILSRRPGKQLETGEVVHTSSGNLPNPIRYVIHAVGPTDHQSQGNASAMISMLEKTFLNCLNHADQQLRVSSISIPPISSGIFGVAMEKIIEGAMEAIGKFDGSSRSHSLKEIHFISNDSKTTEDMVEGFFARVAKK